MKDGCRERFWLWLSLFTHIGNHDQKIYHDLSKNNQKRSKTVWFSPTKLTRVKRVGQIMPVSGPDPTIHTRHRRWPERKLATGEWQTTVKVRNSGVCDDEYIGGTNDGWRWPESSPKVARRRWWKPEQVLAIGGMSSGGDRLEFGPKADRLWR